MRVNSIDIEYLADWDRKSMENEWSNWSEWLKESCYYPEFNGLRFKWLKRYKANGFFLSFQISWITRFIDLSVKTNRTLICSYKSPHHMTFKISFKSLTVFAKVPILYAWLDSEFISDACIFLVNVWCGGGGRKRRMFLWNLFWGHFCLVSKF